MTRRLAAAALTGAALFALTLAAMRADAGSCRAVVSTSGFVHHKAAVVHDVAVVKEVVPVVSAFVPLYGAYYAPPAAPANSAADPALAKALADLAARLAAIEQKLGGQPAAPPPAAPAPPPRDPFNPPEGQPQAQQAPAGDVMAVATALFQAKCAKCHAADGQGGLTLLEAGRAVAPGKLTAEQRLALVERTYTDDPKRVMPPRGRGERLTDQEFAAIIAYVGGAK